MRSNSLGMAASKLGLPAVLRQVVLLLPFCAHAIAETAAPSLDQSPPDGSPYYYADYAPDHDAPATRTDTNATDSNALANYTRFLLQQQLGVYGQGIQIPYTRFAAHACQVVYLGNPDWASLDLQVTFYSNPASTCTGGRGPQAAFAYLDGYNQPKTISGVTLASGKVIWVAAVTGSKLVNGAPGQQGAAAAASPAAPGSSLQDSNSDSGKAVVGRLQRRLAGLGVTGFSGSQLQTGRTSFKSTYDDLRGSAEAVQSLLGGLQTSPTPGPQGPLTLPVLLSPRRGTSVAAASGYREGALVQLDEAYGETQVTEDPLASSELMTDLTSSFWAPEQDCLAALGGSKRSSSSSSSSNSSGDNSTTKMTTLRVSVRGVKSQSSCFATQLVVYLYHPCISSSSSTDADTETNAAEPPPPSSSSSSSLLSASLSNSSSSSSDFQQQERVRALLEKELRVQVVKYALNSSLGHAHVLVTYSSYDKCVQHGVDRLFDVSLQVTIFSALFFGWLVLLLLLPSMYRLVIEFPFRLLVYGIRKLQGKDDTLKPMRPGLHAHKRSSRRCPLPRALAVVVDPLVRLRTQLLYAVSTVHYSDGQSRWLQVAVISTVALSIAQAVYSPGIAPPLEHFVSPLALQITRSSTATAALQYFFDIVVFSSFMGTLGYLSMLANYNSPVNSYYRVQVAISAFFMLLQDLLVVLQLTSLLSQWPYLDPRWPYLPLVIFQLVNLIAANVMQAVIFSKRHDQHDRAVYKAYVASKVARVKTAAVAAETRVVPSTAGRSRGGDGDRRAGGFSRSSSSSSAADDEVIIAELIDGDGCAWRQRKAEHDIPDGIAGISGMSGGSSGSRDYYTNVRRHRQRSAPQLTTKQRRLRAQLGDPQEGEVEEDEERRQQQQRRRPQRLQARAGLETRGLERKGRRRVIPKRDSGDGNGDDGGGGDPAAVVVVAAASDVSRTNSESTPVLPSGRDSRQRCSRRGSEEAEEEDWYAQHSHAAAVAASAHGAPVRPRRRLLVDGSLGPGPVAEAAEDSGSEVLTSGGGGSRSGSGDAATVRTWRRGDHGDDVVENLLEASGSGLSRRGRASRRLLMTNTERIAAGVAAAGGVAAISSAENHGGRPKIEPTAHASHGDGRHGRRLYGGGGGGGPLDEQDGVPYYKRPHNGQRSAAVEPVTTAGHAAGIGNDNDWNGAKLKSTTTRAMTTAVTAKPAAEVAPAAVAAGATSATGDTGRSGRTVAAAATSPRLIKSASMPHHGGPDGGGLQGAGKAAVPLPISRTATSSRAEMLLQDDKDLQARLRDAAAAAAEAAEAAEAATCRLDSDALDSDPGGSSDAEDGGGGDGAATAAGVGGLRGALVAATRPIFQLWRGLREGPDFRYPAWLLAALLVSGYMVVFHYGKALSWSHHLAECLREPASCFTNVVGRYLKFVARLLSTAQQKKIREILTSLLSRRDDLLAGFAESLGVTPGANGTLTAQPLLTLDKQALLEQANSNGILDKALETMSAQVMQSLSGLGADAEDTAAALTASITANLAVSFNATMEQLVDAANTQLTASVRAQTAVYRRINATVNVLYDAINTTSRYITKVLDVQGEIRSWQLGLSERFRWTSVLGFTLGLLLGLSTLLQTAASFRRAIRQGRRMRLARRMFKSLLAKGGNERERRGATTAAAAAAAAPSLTGRDVLLASGAGGGGGEDTLLVTRAREAQISLVVFFFGVLMSTAVLQLYMVGVLLSVALAVLTHPWTWSFLMPKIWLYLVAIVAVVVLNKFILIGYVGNAFLSNGDHIYRPAAWLAFTFIMSITNLVIGLLLALYRIILLLLTTVLSLGKLEVTIFTFFAKLDLPHTSFLAGLHMHEAMSNFHDPIYLPGPRGRAHRRWRKLRDIVRRLKPEELRLLATLGRPKEVQDCLDHVVVDMKAATELAAAGRQLGGGGGGGGSGGGGGDGSRHRGGGSGRRRLSRFAGEDGGGATATAAATAAAAARVTSSGQLSRSLPRAMTERQSRCRREGSGAAAAAVAVAVGDGGGVLSSSSSSSSSSGDNEPAALGTAIKYRHRGGDGGGGGGGGRRSSRGAEAVGPRSRMLYGRRGVDGDRKREDS